MMSEKFNQPAGMSTQEQTATSADTDVSMHFRLSSVTQLSMLQI